MIDKENGGTKTVKNLSVEMIMMMIASAANHLQNHKQAINDLNVFPVPDGDTGTNMSLTFGAAAASVKGMEADTPAEVLEALAKASLRNARGNSGVILSQILRGIAGAVQGDEFGVAEIKEAAAGARDTAYRAVMKPTEGTILTVIREVADFAQETYQQAESAEKFLESLLTAGKESLERTPEILPVLKQAGVVDAGGKGIVTLLEGAVLALQQGAPVALSDEAAADAPKTAVTETINEEIRFLYCTEFLIHKEPDRKINQFSAAIKSKGDCMLVIEDEEIVKVHIHTNHPGYVLEQALKLGELTNLKIDNMKYQHEEKIAGQIPAEEPAAEQKKYGFAAVATGDGMRELFKSLHVDRVVEGGQTMNPSTQDLLDAVQAIPAENVFILPNNKNIILAAEQVDALTGKNVVVIPTKHVPQGIAAMMGFSEEDEVEDNVLSMSDMAESVRCGQVTFAARKSSVDGFAIKKGDILGIADGTILCTGQKMDEVCMTLAEQLVTDESGVLSLYYGADASEAEANRIISESITENLIKMTEAEARKEHGWVEVQGADAIVKEK